MSTPSKPPARVDAGGRPIPKRITPIQLRRHKRMLTLLDEAQALQTEIEAIAEQANAQIAVRAGRRLELLSAWKVWGEELHAENGLPVDGSVDVLPDGSIVHASP